MKKLAIVLLLCTFTFLATQCCKQHDKSCEACVKEKSCIYIQDEMQKYKCILRKPKYTEVRRLYRTKERCQTIQHKKDSVNVNDSRAISNTKDNHRQQPTNTEHFPRINERKDMKIIPNPNSTAAERDTLPLPETPVRFLPFANTDKTKPLIFTKKSLDNADNGLTNQPQFPYPGMKKTAISASTIIEGYIKPSNETTEVLSSNSTHFQPNAKDPTVHSTTEEPTKPDQFPGSGMLSTSNSSMERNATVVIESTEVSTSNSTHVNPISTEMPVYSTTEGIIINHSEYNAGNIPTNPAPFPDSIMKSTPSSDSTIMEKNAKEIAAYGTPSTEKGEKLNANRNTFEVNSEKNAQPSPALPPLNGNRSAFIKSPKHDINQPRLEKMIRRKACVMAYLQKINLYQDNMGPLWNRYYINNPMLRKPKQCAKILAKKKFHF